MKNSIDQNNNEKVNKNLLLDMLIDYSKNDNLAMHMPGHKRNVADFDYLKNITPAIDITEIAGFDNLHNPTSIIADAETRASAFFKSKKSWFLVNGSTSGILAGIKSATSRGDSIAIARNSHKSVYNAIELLGLNPCYMKSEYSAEYSIGLDITLKSVKEVFEKNKNIKLVVITSPSYEGIISDIHGIAKVVHDNNAILMVDEAHGAHLALLNPNLSAVNCGADMVCHSMHKTLPSLTQTAVLHLCSDRVLERVIASNLSIFQTTSPSYMFLSCIDSCIDFLSRKGKKIYSEFSIKLNELYKKLEVAKNFRVIDFDCSINLDDKKIQKDKTKLVLTLRNKKYTAIYVSNILREKYRIEVEYANSKNLLFILTMADTAMSLDRLANAIIEIDNSFTNQEFASDMSKSNEVVESIDNSFTNQDFASDKSKSNEVVESVYQNNGNSFSNQKGSFSFNHIPKAKYNSCETYKLATKEIDIKNAKNKVSAQTILCYPPGVPIIVKGEVFDDISIKHILNCIDIGVELIAESDIKNKIVSVLSE